MRWLLVGIVCALGVFACGGRSDRSEAGDPEDRACEDWRQLDVVEACQTLDPTCPPTLEALLVARGDSARDPLSGPQLEYARIACGKIEVSLVHPVVGGPRYTFGSNGDLVGFHIAHDSPSGPCSLRSYAAGESIGPCSPERTCWLAHDALATGELCACACPYVDDVVAHGPPECVFAPPYGRACLDTAEQMRSNLERGIVRSGCGVTVIAFQAGPDESECWYDNGRAIGGARRLSVPECDGIQIWRTGGPYLSCAEEQRCFFGAGDPPPGIGRCP